MGKRGRRSHPDILTPREWEVLALLREELTNDEIAQRLGISLDGAKYHVSEILSKLGVSRREEAAAWEPKYARPWWRSLVALPLAGKITGATVVAIAAAALGGLLLGVLRTDDGEDAPELSVGLVYQRMEEAMTRPGQVYHAYGTVTGEGPSTGAVKYWIDPAGNRARWIDGPQAQAKLLTDDVLYRQQCPAAGECGADREHPRACPDLSAAVSILLLYCAFGPEFNDKIRVSEAEFRNYKVIALSVDFNFGEGAEAADILDRTFLDANTFLPVGRETGGIRESGGERTMVVTTLESEFVPLESLPADFFDPSSIGYVRTVYPPGEGIDLNNVNPSIDVYWLGQEYAGADGRPSLTLGGVYQPPAPPVAGEVVFEYLASNDDGDVVRLFERDYLQWQQATNNGLQYRGACLESKAIDVPGAQATIFMGYQPGDFSYDDLQIGEEPACPNKPRNRFFGEIVFDSTFISVLVSSDPFDKTGNPYDTLGGVEAILRGLTAR